jgi:hypothetical protein
MVGGIIMKDKNLYRYFKEFKNGKRLFIELKDDSVSEILTFNEILTALKELTNDLEIKHNSVEFDLFHDGCRKNK